jgi:hypothetical protein
MLVFAMFEEHATNKEKMTIYDHIVLCKWKLQMLVFVK